MYKYYTNSKTKDTVTDSTGYWYQCQEKHFNLTRFLSLGQDSHYNTLYIGLLKAH